MEEINEIWDFIIDYNIASEETLSIITSINGYSVETLNDVIYAATGYRSMDQFLGEEPEEEPEEPEEESLILDTLEANALIKKIKRLAASGEALTGYREKNIINGNIAKVKKFIAPPEHNAFYFYNNDGDFIIFDFALNKFIG